MPPTPRSFNLGGIPVKVYMDIDRFEAFLDRLGRKVSEATPKVVDDVAEFVAKKVRQTLSRYPHPLGVPTMSPPFEGPVGMLTTGDGSRIPGHLRDSVRVTHTPFTHSATVEPTAIYSRIQELGGRTGRSGNVVTGTLHPGTRRQFIPETMHLIPVAHVTYLPPRPYFFPTVAKISDVSNLGAIYYEGWARAVEEALHSV